jgi:flagellar biosynthesis protein FlhF
MRIKLFQAANMADAMAQIRAELGADAIILEQRRTRHGVEVTAALEPDEPLLIQPITPPAPLVTSGPLAFHNIAPGLAQALAAAPLAESLANSLGFARWP